MTEHTENHDYEWSRIEELKLMIEKWQKSKFYADLQVWKDEWYRTNGDATEENK